MKDFIGVAENIRAVFSILLKDAIDMEITNLSCDGMLCIGFDWIDTKERPCIDKFQHIIDRRLDMPNTYGDCPIKYHKHTGR